MTDETTVQISHDGTRLGALLGVAPPSNGREDRAAKATVLVCDDPWTGGATDVVDDLVTHLTEAGLAVATLDPSPSISDHLESAEDVLHWLEESPKVDTGRLGLIGCERGAIVAACLAARSAAIGRLCLLAPMMPSDVVRKPRRSKRPVTESGPTAPSDPNLPSGPNGPDDPAVAELDPAADAAKHEGPTLILLGAADGVVPPTSPRAYRDALRRAGRPVEFELLARGNHELTDPSTRAACLERVEAFFADLGADHGKRRSDDGE